jgi:hypothetical protein
VGVVVDCNVPQTLARGNRRRQPVARLVRHIKRTNTGDCAARSRCERRRLYWRWTTDTAATCAVFVSRPFHCSHPRSPRYMRLKIQSSSRTKNEPSSPVPKIHQHHSFVMPHFSITATDMSMRTEKNEPKLVIYFYNRHIHYLHHNAAFLHRGCGRRHRA